MAMAYILCSFTGYHWPGTATNPISVNLYSKWQWLTFHVNLLATIDHALPPTQSLSTSLLNGKGLRSTFINLNTYFRNTFHRFHSTPTEWILFILTWTSLNPGARSFRIGRSSPKFVLAPNKFVQSRYECVQAGFDIVQALLECVQAL